MQTIDTTDAASARFANLDIGDDRPELLGARCKRCGWTPNDQSLIGRFGYCSTCEPMVATINQIKAAMAAQREADLAKLAPAPRRNVPRAIRAGEVDATAKERCEADEAIARAAGFAPKAPIYAIGSRVNETGVGNFRASRQKYEDLPYAVDALWELATRVRNEDRQNLQVEAKALRLEDDGRLVVPGFGTVPMTAAAFERMASDLTPGGSTYLKNCEPALRAHNLNKWIADARNASRSLQLRHRASVGGGREIFASVGPRYAAHDVDAVADQIAAAVPPGSRAEVMADAYCASTNCTGGVYRAAPAETKVEP